MSATSKPAQRFRRIVLVVLATVFSLLAPAAALLAPRAGQAVAVIAWSPDAGGAAAIAARADGNLIAAGRSGRIVVAQSPDADFVARLYQAGALAVLDASTVTACLSPVLAFASELRL